MSFLVKQINDVIDLAIDQGISNYFTRSQICDAIDQAQMSVFRELLKEYPKTKYIRNELRPFQTATNVSISGASGPLPSDFEHEIEANTTVSSVKYPVKFVEDGMFRKRVLDPVDPPSTTNAFAHIYNTSGPMVELSPTGVTGIQLIYFKRPVKPVYGTTGVQYTYDESTSTDLRWSNTMYDVLVERTLKILGLGMKDGMVYRLGETAEMKNASIK